MTGMRDGEPGDVRQLDDVRALASLAHPDRSRLLDALTVHGPSTTTELAQALGLATGSVSHHLKVMVDAGLVEPAETESDRRKRRWRLVTRGLRWQSGGDASRPAAETAGTAADLMLLRRDTERAQRFLDAAGPPWSDAAFAAHVWLRLDPAELEEFGRELEALLLRWRRREIPNDGTERAAVLAFARAFPTEP
jgi:DNA-binding MarR family transcriptional regulator